MRRIVDEKLQKTLSDRMNESFKPVSYTHLVQQIKWGGILDEKVACNERQTAGRY